MYQSIELDIVHNRQCFLDTLKFFDSARHEKKDSTFWALNAEMVFCDLKQKTNPLSVP